MTNTIKVTKKSETFAVTWGDDVQIKSSGGTDTLYFKDVNQNDVTILKEQEDRNLIITISAEGKEDLKVTLLNYFAKDLKSPAHSVKNYKFEGGNILNIVDSGFITSEDLNFVFYPTKKGVVNGSVINDKIDMSLSEKGLTIDGNNGHDTIIGTNYDDTIYGGNGNDIITGGQGNDLLYGGNGDNTFIFNKNDGNDTIISGKGKDTIVIKEQINELTGYEWINGRDLVLSYGNNDFITIKDFSNGNSSVKTLISEFEDEAGTTKRNEFTLSDHIKYDISGESLSANLKTVNGTKLNDNINLKDFQGTKGLKIYGNDGNDTITGTDYRDTIYGGVGNDSIVGGKGNDKLYGDSGNNTYYFSYGDGVDTIYSGKGNDTVIFNKISGYLENFADLVFEKDKNNLIIKYTDKDSIVISDYFKGKSSINTVKIGDKVLEDFATDVAGKLNKRAFTTNKKGTVWTGTDIGDYISFADDEKTQNGKTIGFVIKTGKGNDFVDAGIGNDTLYGGNGQNNFNFDHGDGNDVLYIGNKNTDTDYIALQNAKVLSAVRKGNDVLITYGKENVEETDTILVKDYYKKKGNVKVTPIPVLDEESEEMANMSGAKSLDKYVNITADKKGKINGSFRNDILVGDDKNNTIYTGVGNDTVNAGLGNDKIYINGNGDKVLTFDTGSGNDTIYGYNKSTSTIVDLKDSADGVQYIKSGNDLIIERSYDEKSDKVTIKDYYKGDNSKLIIKAGNQELEVEDVNVTGTDKSEKIYTVAGDNTIVAGKGNDVINIIGDGKKDVYIKNADGNDTITGIENSTALNIHFEEIDDGVQLEFTKKGNDFIIRRSYSDTKGKAKTATTTITNLFKRGTDGSWLNTDKIHLFVKDDVPVDFDKISIGISGKGKIDGTPFADFILGSKGNDTINSNGGNDYLRGGKGNDTYNVLNLEDNIFIQDEKGNDTLNILNSNSWNVNFIFNVNKDGKFGMNEDNLFLYKDDEALEGWDGTVNSISNGITIEGFNSIEKIKTEDGGYIVTKELNALKEKVTSWLNTNNYDDVQSVLESGNSQDRDDLMAIFNSVDWQGLTIT